MDLESVIGNTLNILCQNFMIYKIKKSVDKVNRTMILL